MGKEGGFLEYGRKDHGYRPKRERVKDYPSMRDITGEYMVRKIDIK